MIMSSGSMNKAPHPHSAQRIIGDHTLSLNRKLGLFGISSSNIKEISELHGNRYGNLWITPFNYFQDRENKALLEKKKLSKFYEEFHNKATFSPTHQFGNAAKTINYVANGEASDWFLGRFGIFSISPELGDDRQASNTFYPPKSEILPILENCYPPIDFLIQKMMFSPKVIFSNEAVVPEIQALSTQEQSSVSTVEIQLYNEALVDLEVKEIKLYLKTSHNQNLPLTVLGTLYTISNEDQETAANDSLFGNTTLNFLARSYLNLTILLSKKDLEEIQNKYLLQNLLVLKLNDQKEILIKNVDYLKLKSTMKENYKGSSNDWAWFLVSLSILLIFIIVISVGLIIANRKRNFFERLKISADKGIKALPGLDSEPKRGYSDFNPENEI